MTRVPFHQLLSSLLFTVMFQTGWGAHLQELTVSGKWKRLEQDEYISTLGMREILKALFTFQDRTISQGIVLRPDSSSVMAYINKYG